MQILTTDVSTTFRISPRILLSNSTILTLAQNEQSLVVDMYLDDIEFTQATSYLNYTRDTFTRTTNEWYWIKVYKVTNPDGRLREINIAEGRKLQKTYVAAHDMITQAYQENEITGEVFKGKAFVTNQTADSKYSMYSAFPFEKPSRPDRQWITA